MVIKDALSPNDEPQAVFHVIENRYPVSKPSRSNFASCSPNYKILINIGVKRLRIDNREVVKLQGNGELTSVDDYITPIIFYICGLDEPRILVALARGVSRQ